MKNKIVILLLIILSACSNVENNHDDIVGVWVVEPIYQAQELGRSTFYNYQLDSTYLSFHGDYSIEGKYLVKDSELTIFQNNETLKYIILELNDSILKLKDKSSDYNFSLYRWGSVSN